MDTKGGEVGGHSKNIDIQVENKFIAFKQYSSRYNTVKAATQLCWVTSICFKKSIGFMLIPLNLQVMCRCSPKLRPVLPLMPTTSPALTVCPFNTETRDR